MLELFTAARLWLANLDPAAPAVTLMLGVFLVIYAIRRWLPRVWIWVEGKVPFVDSLDDGPARTIIWKAAQSWPAALLGAAGSALANGGSPVAAIKGAALGLAVVVIHELAAAYKGKLGTPKPKPPSATLGGPATWMLCALTLVLACGLPGCSLFGPGGSVWPKVENCAPSAASLISQVGDVLLAGGDYEAALEALALKDGAAAVECAVKAFVDAVGGKVGAPRSELMAAGRGKAFLAKVAQ